MTTGRAIAEASIKPLLVAAGWRARASGWFTKDLTAGATAVLAVGAASRHQAPGSTIVTVYVGLRDDETERVVEEVTGVIKPHYQGRTWVTPLGHLLPGASFTEGELAFDEGNAPQQATRLASAITVHAEPKLRQIIGDRGGLAALTACSVSAMGAPGLCRIAALTCHTQGFAAASAYVAERVASLGDRADAAAGQERDAAPRVLAVLAGTSPR